MITLPTIIDNCQGWAGAAAIYRPEHVEGWKAVTKAVHDADGVIFCQLWHLGRVAHSCFHNLQPIGASAIAAEGRVTDYDGTKHAYEVPRAVELSDIPAILDEYRIASRNAKEAGFDGIELHGANGYFIDTFLQSCSNTRTDQYGGSVENRFRLLSEIIDVCKESFPSQRIGVRLSPNGSFNGMGSDDNFESYMTYLAMLNEKDLAYVHIMDGLGFGFHDKCQQLKLSDARQVYKGFIIGNVGYTRDSAEEVIQAGYADAIAFGRPFIPNPDLPQRFENDWPLAETTHDAYWTYPNFPDGDPSVGYTDYPAYSSS